MKKPVINRLLPGEGWEAIEKHARVWERKQKITVTGENLVPVWGTQNFSIDGKETQFTGVGSFKLLELLDLGRFVWYMKPEESEACKDALTAYIRRNKKEIILTIQGNKVISAHREDVVTVGALALVEIFSTAGLVPIGYNAGPSGFYIYAASPEDGQNLRPGLWAAAGTNKAPARISGALFTPYGGFMIFGHAEAGFTLAPGQAFDPLYRNLGNQLKLTWADAREKLKEPMRLDIVTAMFGTAAIRKYAVTHVVNAIAEHGAQTQQDLIKILLRLSAHPPICATSQVEIAYAASRVLLAR